MVDLAQARTLIELRTGDRTGCLPGCSFDNVCKTWLLYNRPYLYDRSNIAGRTFALQDFWFVWFNSLRTSQIKDIVKGGS